MAAPKTPAKARALPTREELLAFVADTSPDNGRGARLGKREIARAFGVKGADKGALKTLIKDMQAEGELARGRKTLRAQGRLPALVAADIVERASDGELIAKPVEWNDDEGAPPRILIHRPRVKRDRDPAPGIGARVLMRVTFNPDAVGRAPPYSGRVVKIIDKAKPRAFGVLHLVEGGGGRVSPVEKRGMAREWFVPPGMIGDAEDGDLVALETLREGRFGAPTARVVESLGSLKSERAISKIAIATHNIPDEFAPATLAEAGAAPTTFGAREDWRALPLITIDPADAKDHDDAVHAALDDDPANAGGFVLTVAIADVAYYVRPGSALDKEALERGNSVYFPDRVVPMLPERISNDLCSLRPSQDRPALAVRMIIGKDGRKRSHTFHRIAMRSAAKLSYPQAQRAIDGEPDDITGPLLDPVLKPLYAAYDALKLERDERGPLDLDLPERKLILDSNGALARVEWPARLDAHRLIEECMILANVAAAESLEAARAQLIYRAHDSPSFEKLRDLADFLVTIGVTFNKGERIKPAQFNGILSRVRGEPHEGLVNEVVLRSQAQAEYTNENYGHFGLNLRRYAHFTSPIRRYADLIVHRALIRALNLGAGGMPDLEAGALADIAQRISGAERRAMAAERETADRLIATHLSDRIGASFDARISGVTRVGLFVKLTETGADGFIPAATLGADYYRFEESARALVGTRTGETFRLGDSVEVKLLEAAPFAGALRFEMLSHGTSRKRVKALKIGPGRDRAQKTRTS